MRAMALRSVGLVVCLCIGCAVDVLNPPKRHFAPGPMVDLESPRDIQGGPGQPISDKQELDIVEPLLEHRTMYARYLKALAEYYEKHGFLNKQTWALTELADLRRVPTYSYGADVGQLRLGDIPVAGRQEVDLVEELVTHRKMYNRLLTLLVRHYAAKEDHEKLKWAELEREELSYVKPYQYLMSATIPLEGLRPQASIAEADALYEEGLKLMKKGGHGVPALYNRRIMKQALNKFHTLLMEYPTSDKIALAAWWAGYIHKEYFYDLAQNVDDNEIAVQYFERAYTWDPNIPQQARFEAATVYDFRLHDRERALKLYQDVIEKETFVKSNVDFAHKRIRQLTKELHETRPGVPDNVVKAPPAPEPPAGEQAQEASPAAPKPAATPKKSDRPIAP